MQIPTIYPQRSELAELTNYYRLIRADAKSILQNRLFAPACMNNAP